MQEKKNTIISPLIEIAKKKIEVPKKKKSDLAPQKLKMLIMIVNRKKTDFYIDLLQTFESNLQFSRIAYGTANSETLQMLGLVNEDKSVIFSIIREDKAEEILNTLTEKFNTVNNGKGIAFTVPLTSTIGVAVYRFLSNNRTAVKEK